MPEVERAIISKLLGDSSITNLVQNRIYFSEAPQGVLNAYAVINRISSPRVHSLTGPSGLVKARIQIDIYAYSAMTARTIGRAIEAILDGLREIVITVNIQAILLLDEFDGYEEGPELKRLIQDYRVWYQA